MSEVRMDFSREELEAICRRRAVKRLALFGSVLRDDFGPESDVDVLIEFREDFEGKQIYRIWGELEELFGGRRVLVQILDQPGGQPKQLEKLSQRGNRGSFRPADELPAG